MSGDAIAFTHALHKLDPSGNGYPGKIYQDTYHLTPIKVTSEEDSDGISPPLKFSVIDTSNLIDHLVALNLILATSPLLNNSPASTLYTRSLVKRKKEHKAYIDSLLCGHFATVTLLLGLSPVEYGTNATSTSTADEIAFDTALRQMGADGSGQMRVDLSWKRLNTPLEDNAEDMGQRLQINEVSLAYILYDVYRKMFQHKDLAWMFKGIDQLKL